MMSKSETSATNGLGEAPRFSADTDPTEEDPGPIRDFQATVRVPDGIVIELTNVTPEWVAALVRELRRPAVTESARGSAQGARDGAAPGRARAELAPRQNGRLPGTRSAA